jgi:hypothetical protein
VTFGKVFFIITILKTKVCSTLLFTLEIEVLPKLLSKCHKNTAMHLGFAIAAIGVFIVCTSYW